MCELLEFRGLRAKLTKDMVHSGGVDPDQMSKPTSVGDANMSYWGEAREGPRRLRTSDQESRIQRRCRRSSAPGSPKDFPRGTVLPSAGTGVQALW